MKRTTCLVLLCILIISAIVVAYYAVYPALKGIVCRNLIMGGCA